MIALIEIIIALIILGILAVYISHVVNIFAIIPSSLMTLFMFALAIDLVLFIIHRKGN